MYPNHSRGLPTVADSPLSRTPHSFQLLYFDSVYRHFQDCTLHMILFQASRNSASNTSNIHSYFNFNLALKDQHLSGLLSSANLHSTMLLQNKPSSPAGTPPLQGVGYSTAALSTGTLSHESSPMSDKSSDIYQHHQTSQQMKHEAGGFHPLDMRSFHENLPVQFQEGMKRTTAADYMMPGSARVIHHADERGDVMSANGKRLPIFNQLSDPVC